MKIRVSSYRNLLLMGLLYLVALPAQAALLAGSVLSNQASVYFTDPVTGDATVISSQPVRSRVIQVSAFKLSGAATKPALANELVFFQHTLQNLGNGDDTFRLSLSGRAPDGRPLQRHAGTETGLAQAQSLRLYPDQDGDGLPDAGKPELTQINLSAGQSIRFVAALQITPDAREGDRFTLTVEASASATAEPAAKQSVTDAALITDRAVAQIKVQKVFSRISGPAPSEVITVTLSYSNPGATAARRVVIRDFIGYARPQFNGTGFAYVSGSARWVSRAGATLSDEDDGLEPGFDAGQGIAFNALKQNSQDALGPAELNFVLDTVEAGGTGILQFQVQVLPTAERGVTTTRNQVELEYHNGRAPVVGLGENIAFYDVRTSASLVFPDLTLSKQAVSDFYVNTPAQYRLTVRNNGRAATDGPITVSDRLPKDLDWLPATTGTGGWVCSQSLETRDYRQIDCTHPATVFAGQDHPVPLFIGVMPLDDGVEVVNTASVSGGGEAEAQAGNNQASHTLTINEGSSIAGSVWLDSNHDRRRDRDEPGLSGWRIELLNSNGFVLRTATSGSDGSYRIAGVPPLQTLKLQFRENAPGFPVRGTPVNGEQGFPDRDSNAVIRNGIIDAISLQPGDTLEEQSLPYTPSGTVYDAITRAPLPGTTVEMIGPVSFDPAQHLVGGSDVRSQLTGAQGAYQFLLTASAPAGVYELKVKQPASREDGNGNSISYKNFFSLLLPPAETIGACDGRDFCLNPTGLADAGELFSVNRDRLAFPPPAGRDTRYFVHYFLDPALAPQLINNHLPLDPSVIGGDQLLLQKTANKTQADIGDIVSYTVSLNNTTPSDMSTIEIVDTPAKGFVFIRGSARWRGEKRDDPVMANGSMIFRGMPVLPAGTIGKLEYRMRIGANALGSNGINRAYGTAVGFTSNTATHQVSVQSGLFGDDGFVVGKVFTDCDADGVQGRQEVGVPAVRLYLQDGTFVITDAEGKYSLYGLKSRTHVIKVDPITMPPGAELVPISNRHAGTGDSSFIDMEGGELNRADFAIGNCTSEVMSAIVERRSSREIYKAETEQRIKSRLETSLSPLPRSDVRQLPAQGVVDAASDDVNAFWTQRTRDKTKPPSSLMYKSSFLQDTTLKQAPDHLQKMFEDADSALAFMGIRDGDVLPLDVFDFYVKGPLQGNFKVLLNGTVLSDRFVGRRLEDSSKGFQAREYVGTRFRYGSNELEVRTEDGFGNVRGKQVIKVMAPATLARLKLAKLGDKVPADGNSLIRFRITLEDENGTPVTVRTPLTLEAAAGRLMVEDLNPDEPGYQTFMQGGQIEFALESPQVAGAVKVMASSGIITATETVNFVPELRPLIAVGLVDGMIRFGDFNRNNILPLRQKETFEKELSFLSHQHGKTGMGMRAAAFLKGRVRGDYLLTLSYDTDKSMKDRLFRDIRPDAFYPVYGDSSIRGFDAQSTSQLYVRIDKNSSYLLYGDFSTSDNTEGVELGRYSRGLTGVKAHLGEDKLKGSLFASQDTARQQVEEFAANGTSGPFQLNARNIVINSERIEVLTRDRELPSIILQTQTLQRFTDYEVEFFSGRLLLKAPLASLDSNLNPRSLRVSYEVEAGGSSFWVYGGEVSMEVSDKLRIGSMFARDEDPLKRFAMNAAHLIFKATENDKLQLELAQTDTAFKGAGNAYRIDFAHDKGKLAAKLKFVSSTEAFDNVLSGYAGGRQDGSFSVLYRINQETQLKAEVLTAKDQVSGSERTGEMISVTRTLTPSTNVEVGLRNVNQKGANVTAESERYTTARLRLNHALAHLSRATSFLEYEQDVSDSQQRVMALGGEYAFASRGKLYLRHELISSIQGPYSLNDQQQRNATVFGVETDYLKGGHVFSEYRVRDALAQREAEAAFGVRHNWVMVKNVNLSASVERVQAISGPDTGESIAATVGADVVRNENTRLSSRIEWRDGNNSKSWLKLLSLATKLSDDWTFLTRTIVTNTRASDDSSHQDLARVQVGVAYRQTDLNEWSMLARYERVLEREQVALKELEVEDVDIFSVQSNFQPTRALVHRLRAAAKQSRQRIGSGQLKTMTYLISQRLTFDMTKRIDLGLQAAMLAVRHGGRQFSTGVEIGYLLQANFWLSGGYNFFGFDEEYLTEDENTGQGFYIRLRVKF